MIYLLVLTVLIGCMALCDAKGKLFVFRKLVPALGALILGTAVFLIWDLVAIDQGIFLHRDSPLMTGVMLAEQLPLEEGFFLFFLCWCTAVLTTGTPVVLRWIGRGTRQAREDEHVA